MFNSGTDYLPILFSASILPESGTSEAIHDAILEFLEEKKEWLKKWQDKIEQDFEHYEHDINPNGLDLAKLGDGGNVMTDGCNGARLFNRMMVDTIRRKAKESALINDNLMMESVGNVIVQSVAQAAAASDDGTQDDGDGARNDGASDDSTRCGSTRNEGAQHSSRDDGLQDDGAQDNSVNDAVLNDGALAMESYCHHHLRNVWWGGLIKETSKILRNSLSGSLEDIDARLRISPNMKNILHSLDKCFSLPANYPKGNGTEFKYWAKRYHQDAPLYPVQRSSGSHNDMVLEGAVAAYINA